MILAIEVILDSCYKTRFVEFCYTKLYGPGSIENVQVRLRAAEALINFSEDSTWSGTSFIHAWSGLAIKTLQWVMMNLYLCARENL